MAAHLNSGRVNLGLLRETARRELLQCLDKCPGSKRVADMVLRRRREMADVDAQIPPQIDSLILIDRNVDMLTPLFTQLTYEGLIDEFYGIHNTTAKFPGEHFTQDESKGGPGGSQQSQVDKKVILNSGDQLYCEIRDLNFQAVGPVLSRRAKHLSAIQEEGKGAKSVGELKQFVHKLPHFNAEKQSVILHTTIGHLIKEGIETEEFVENLHVEQEFLFGPDKDKPNPHIEKCIGLNYPLIKVLRLICMQCLINSGFKPKLLESYKKDILQTYGFEHIYQTLTPLEKVGLLKLHNYRSFPTISKDLHLLDENVDEKNPKDISYVHSGYAPLSVRLVQSVSRNQGWRGLEETCSLLPGESFEHEQQLPPALQKKSNSEFSENNQRVTLVYFIGGCTFSEVAALRFLSQQENSPTDYIIATTKLINGSSWIESIMERDNQDSNDLSS